MSDRAYSRERDSGRTRRRSPGSPRTSRSPSPRRYSRSPSHHRSRRSPPSASSSTRRQPNEAHRENPIPSAVLGVFGLSQYTTERDLKDLFHKFGRIKDVQIVIDKKTNKSRGFGFVYFEEIESATRAKEALNSTELDHHRLRIDYSVTKRAHTPTPGIYMGVRTAPYHRANGHSYRRSPSPDRKSSHRRHRHRYTRSRSYSRSRSRSRSRRGGDRRRRSPGYAYD
jgi:transformer-2 protein